MPTQPRKQTIAVHILSDISISKDNEIRSVNRISHEKKLS